MRSLNPMSKTFFIVAILALGLTVWSVQVQAQTCNEIIEGSIVPCMDDSDCQTAECPDCIACAGDNGDGQLFCILLQGCPFCGDGTIDTGEICDDGGTPAGCPDDCVPDEGDIATCGDGIPFNTPGEQCDDGNIIAGDGCSNCMLPVADQCGNGFVDPGEDCDDGNMIDGDGCTGCQQWCGDGFVNLPGEMCDDGILGGGPCPNNCQGDPSLPVCGNGIVEGAEVCDDGDGIDNNACNNSCQPNGEFCGDGIVNGTEVCDDGDPFGGPCPSDCQPGDGDIVACGDGIAGNTLGEICDDGNVIPGDGCTNCQLDLLVCGNGIVEGGETCDDGPGGVCPDDCNPEEGMPICGDGVVDPGEICDDGGAPGGCPDDCVPGEGDLAVCGDGIVGNTAGEQCDDGNLLANDGCSDCQLENPELCGNGVLDPGETCDDGNNINNDGCSAFCQSFGLDAQIIPLTGICVQGSGNAPGNLDTNCAGCSLNPFASSKGFWGNYGAFLLMLSAAALAWVLRHRLRATNA